MNPILQRIAERMDGIAKEGRLRQLPAISNARNKYLQLGGKSLLNLASNDYLGLSGSPLLARAARAALEEYGTSSGASRLVTGNNSLYSALEKELAAYKGQEAALVFSSGFTANLALMASLADRHTLVFSDRLNHASILDGITLSGARQIRYRHNDLNHLAELLNKHRACPYKLIVTDSVFSMDGDRADLQRLVELKHQHDCLLIIDEAHATGIFGQGRGLAHELGVAQEIDLQMGTFSKALGSFGGYVAASRSLIDYLINTGRSLIYTTGLPPATLAANLAALQLIQENPAPGLYLRDLARQLCEQLQEQGFATAGSSSQIVPVVIGTNTRVLQLQQRLITAGIYVGAIRPPTVPQGTARLRIALRADLTKKEFSRLNTTLLEILCA